MVVGIVDEEHDYPLAAIDNYDGVVAALAAVVVVVVVVVVVHFDIVVSGSDKQVEAGRTVAEPAVADVATVAGAAFDTLVVADTLVVEQTLHYVMAVAVVVDDSNRLEGVVDNTVVIGKTHLNASLQFSIVAVAYS